MRARLYCLAGLAGLMAAASGPQAASAEELNKVVRTLNAVLNPQDARRYEDRARQNGRPEEERYWRDYRAGLETQHREPDSHQIGAEEARRYEERAHRNHRADEERYWRDYRGGLR